MSVSVRKAEPERLPGKYRVLLELGQGGTAVVYLAVAQGPSGFNKLVVLKALKSNLSNDPEFRKMFLNEARLSARLNHPNIVQVNEVFEQDGLPVIVMQYLEGQPLSEILTRVADQVPVGMHLRVLTEVLSGLHYSHELTDYDGAMLNVVHRDMTPHNVFVTFDGQIKILDFGIAKLSGSTVETQTGVIKGKLRYMPPEQISGDEIDRRTDIFAVGIMLWEAAAGTRMWKGMSEANIMNRVLKGDIPSPRTMKPDLHPELERIIMKALAYDKEDRHASAQELQNELEAYMSQFSSPYTGREIGRFVTQHFEDVRSETKRAIDQQLSQTSFASDTGQGPVSFPPPSSTVKSTGYTASTSMQTDMVGGARRSAAVWLLGLLALGFAGVGIWGMASRSGERTAAAQSKADQLAAPANNKVQFRVTAFPATSKIFLDEKELPGNPFAEARIKDGGQHKLRVQATGYKSRVETIRFDADQDLVLVLEKEEATPVAAVAPAAPKASSNTARPRPAAAPKPPPAPQVEKPSPKPDCTPPYFIDSRGLKKFKPGCI